MGGYGGEGCSGADPGNYDHAAMPSVTSTRNGSHPAGLMRANPSGHRYGRSSLVMFGSPRREGIRSSSGTRQTWRRVGCATSGVKLRRRPE